MWAMDRSHCSGGLLLWMLWLRLQFILHTSITSCVLLNSQWPKLKALYYLGYIKWRALPPMLVLFPHHISLFSPQLAEVLLMTWEMLLCSSGKYISYSAHSVQKICQKNSLTCPYVGQVESHLILPGLIHQTQFRSQMSCQNQFIIGLGLSVARASA